MKTRLPRGLRIVFLGHDEHRPSLPLHGDWADLRFFDVGRGWSKACAEAALTRPDLTFFLLDEAFDAQAAAAVPGHRVGMVTRPPHGASGPWDLAGWRQKALHAITWHEPPPRGERTPDAIIPLPVDRSGLKPPDFKRRTVVIPRWAAPPEGVLEHLRNLEEFVVLEPQGSLQNHLRVLDGAGVYLNVAYDAAGRLDPLPLHALARGLLVISTTPFLPTWGIEPEDDFLVRAEGELLAAIDEHKRIPASSRAVRVRAWQKAAEFFDADEVFQRLVVDLLLTLDVALLLGRDKPARAASSRSLRSVK